MNCVCLHVSHLIFFWVHQKLFSGMVLFASEMPKCIYVTHYATLYIEDNCAQKDLNYNLKIAHNSPPALHRLPF